MQSVKDFMRQGNVVPASLIASAFIAFLTVMSLLIIPLSPTPSTSMRLEPLNKTVTEGEIFTVDVIVDSSIPVNVFAGDLYFDTQTLSVESIAYNTSIADLWAEEPWYSNGDGTLNFAGGTTRKGGFTGTDKLISVTFKATGVGNGRLSIDDATILQHDGLGTDAPLSTPIDAIFTIAPEATTTDQNLIVQTSLGTSYNVVATPPSIDLNGDGKQSIADTSIFLLKLTSNDPRYDFNLDGEINLKDLNILLGPS